MVIIRITPPPYPFEVRRVVYSQVRVASGQSRGGCRVVARWVCSGSHAASFATRNWSGPRASAARLCIGVMLALATSPLAVSPVGAQMCHETVRHDTHARPASQTTRTAEERLPQQVLHSPAMHQASPHQASAPVMRGAQAVRSRDCCCEGDGREPVCPSSCPTGVSCATHGSLTALDAGEHATAPDPVNSPEPRAVGEYPDSWFGSLDTPPPRS